MAKKRFSPEQLVTMLRQIEVATAQGKSISIACREAGISDQSYFRWRKEYGGLDVDRARKMKELEKENARLKRLVADLSLEKRHLVGKLVSPERRRQAVARRVPPASWMVKDWKWSFSAIPYSCLKRAS